ncbi:LysM domain-containing protein [Stenotrophomonas sp. HITSZ_GD]|uniref:LysM domain-containing protein n=1 Tax=Stenotrophomonas sp. HITSZ_GD TaxID=3037248 RepID=UPI00240D977E|nr:LysM domain-containing protein [Stenotrophomonas sp. HITSZ_GD]MDG2524152.1 LysM domain-containing protein [Stenotrophomonas sp. HITSZ_GD]
MANYDFPPTSRYHGIAVATLTLADGTAVPYLTRRLLPPVEGFTILREHRVVEGERPDLVAARELGDPEAFWRLCDANGVMHPDELTDEVGECVRVALPDGVPPPARE